MLIRESDFKKFEKTDAGTWDLMEFRPVTKVWLQKQANWFTLKGNKNIATQYRHWQYPSEWLRRTNISKYQMRIEKEKRNTIYLDNLQAKMMKKEKGEISSAHIRCTYDIRQSEYQSPSFRYQLLRRDEEEKL